MTTKEILTAELESLTEAELATLLEVARGLAAKDQAFGTGQGLLSKLRQVVIDAPEDFAANLDLYVSGERRAGHGEGVR